MRLLRYMGHHHVAWSNWQGHSNGWKLRVGFRKKHSPRIVFYISWFRFYFYICKIDHGVRFRYLRLLSHEPIYFSSKQKRTIDNLLHNIIPSLQNEVCGLRRQNDDLKDIEKKCGERMRQLTSLYADTIRLNEDFQIEDRIEVSLKEELYGREFHCPHQKRLVTFRKKN